MKKIRHVVLFTAAILISISTARTARADSVTISMPVELRTGNQIYSPTLSGLEDYMNTLRSTRPDLAAKLQPDLDALKTRQTIAQAGLITGLASGAYFIGTAITTMTSSTASDAGQAQAKGDALMTDFALGAGLMMAGSFFFMFETPSQSDFFRFLNKHNQLNPSAPLDLRVGVGLSHEKSPDLTLSMSF